MCRRRHNADNGAPFKNAWLARTCAVLGVRLVHSKPYAPQGRGKQERLNRFISESFLAEALHQGIATLEELNDLFGAWAAQVANRRVHAETLMTPLARFEAGGPPRQVDPALVGRRVELRYDPEDLTQITVYLEGRPAGTATPFVVGRHVHRAVPQAKRPVAPPTGIDFLQMVAAAHDEEAGTGGKVDFSQLQMFSVHEDEEER